MKKKHKTIESSPTTAALQKLNPATETTFLRAIARICEVPESKSASIFAGLVESGTIECVGMAGNFPRLPIYSVVEIIELKPLH